MHDTTPTHVITHRHFGTRAAVRLADSIETALQGDNVLSRIGAQDHVAIAFKKTTPIEGRSLSHVRHINYGDLEIKKIDRVSDDDGEPSPPMDHHGDPLVGHDDE